MSELWKDIEGYEDCYEVSTDGRVISTKTGHVLKGCIVSHGYIAVTLYKKGKGRMFLLHRLVAQAFIPNPESREQVNHINGNKADNRVSNLEWATPQENRDHAEKIGLTPWGASSAYGCQLKTIREECGLSQEELARISGVSLRRIRCWEDGTYNFNTASVHQAHKIAEALNVSIERIAGWRRKGG